jgi:hypothetical protein
MPDGLPGLAWGFSFGCFAFFAFGPFVFLPGTKAIHGALQQELKPHKSGYKDNESEELRHVSFAFVCRSLP